MTGSSGTARTGLATIALLKVNFDSGRDHIGMFEPFVLDVIAHVGADGVTVNDVRDTIIERHQLALPAYTLRTLLGRTARNGYLNREAGRYFRTDVEINVDDLRVERERVEKRQSRLAEALCVAAAERGTQISSAEDALALILNFLERYHVSLALDESLEPRASGVNEPTDDTRPDTVLVAAFLQETILAGGELAAIVQEMLEGFILQNTLLLKDISTAKRRFQNLHVFCDSIFLFGALGLRGSATEAATRELLTLLKETGAILDVFEPTIREMRRILAVYESHLGTADGRAALYQTDMTRYFLTGHYSPSDVRIRSELLERDLRSLGFSVRDLPMRQAQFTLDEADLGTRLAKQPGGENEPRVVHDIDCVAGVLTYRRGKKSDSMDLADAVFLTTSGLTAQTVADWYEAQGGRGVPPIAHYLTLSNLAWLKRPASAAQLKLHELVALCVAALRPSRKVWQTFLSHLKKLEASGQLSSDAVTAIVASGLTDRVLVEEAIDEDSDAETLSEVVERVKAQYREEADAEIDEARRAAETSEAEAAHLRMNLEHRARGLASAAS